MKARFDLAAARTAAQRFQIAGELADVAPLQRGHIHDTFVSTWRQDGRARRFLHQRMNDRVFQDIPAVMHNIDLVSRHLRDKMRGLAGAGAPFTGLELVATREGKSYLLADDGPWRTYRYVEECATFDRCDSPERAYEAARAFGWFQAQLSDLDASQLRETLPRFFSSPHRLRQFDDALAEDPVGRAAGCLPEIRFVAARRDQVPRIDDLLRSGRLPLRPVHGDTKLNNVLFDEKTGKARCIVDLDTCMPGWSLYDFGDLVRFTAATSAEDERDLPKVGTDLGLYRALVEGYLAGTGGFLTADEVALMPFAARLVTMTIGLRFLADHLAGDVYFKVHHEGHNLDRARVQFRMVERMEEQAEAMAVS